jgi:hypothetical protein
MYNGSPRTKAHNSSAPELVFENMGATLGIDNLMIYSTLY